MKKKITVLHPSLVMAGEERVLVNLLNSLDYEKVDVTLWLAESGGVLEKKLRPEIRLNHIDYEKCFPGNTIARMLR